MLPDRGCCGQVVLVSFTSIKPDFPHDPACVVRAGEHSFIVQDSYIYYREPRIEPASHVQSMVDKGVWRPMAQCGQALIDRIVAGFQESKRVPRHVRALF